MRDTVKKSFVVVYSYHHQNTQQVAEVVAHVLDAPIKTPQEIFPEELQEYQLIGFGSGIYGAKHHQVLLDLADRLPHVTEFISCEHNMTSMVDELIEIVLIPIILIIVMFTYQHFRADFTRH